VGDLLPWLTDHTIATHFWSGRWVAVRGFGVVTDGRNTPTRRVLVAETTEACVRE